jgi:hypothetical protein
LKVKLAKAGQQVPITDAAILARKDYFLDHFPLPSDAAAPKSTTGNKGSKNNHPDWLNLL